MQNSLIEKWNRWMLPTMVILFIAQAILLPHAVGFTWADPNSNPDHTLTYTQNKLTWDSATGIRADGSAVLDLFDDRYDGTVLSGDGQNVVAPGTTKSNVVRLKNNVSGSITYTAVLYEIKSDPSIPVTVSVNADGAASTTNYSLPTGVSQDQVVQAITGTVSGKQLVNFDTVWNWNYEDGAQQDAMDTLLGNQGSDEVTVGLYIIVEDGNSYVTPSNPKTGDNSNVGLYAVLMVVSFVLLILLLWDRRREEESEISN